MTASHEILDHTQPRMLTTSQAAEALSVDQSTIHAWMKSGRLRAFRIGPRNYRIREDDLASMVQVFVPTSPAVTR